MTSIQSKKLFLGIVGGGPKSWIGHVHRIASRFDDHYEIVAGVFSRNPKLSKMFGKSLGISSDRCYSNYKEMAEKEGEKKNGINVVSIMTPPASHQIIAEQFINKNIHVISDKPFAGNLHQAKKLYKKIKSNKNIKYALTHNYSAYPMVRQAKQIVEKGKIGKAYSVQAEVGQYLPNWRPRSDYRTTVSAQKRLGGGVLLELSHEIDYILWFFDYTKKVFATFSQNKILKTNVEEATNIFFYQKKNYIINARVNFNQKFLQNRYCIVSGTKGLLKWDIIKNTINFTNQYNKTIIFKFKDNSFKNQLLFLIQQINKKKIKKINTIKNSLKVLELINKIKKSNNQKKLINTK